MAPGLENCGVRSPEAGIFGRRGGNVALETLPLKRGTEACGWLVVEDDKDLNRQIVTALAQPPAA